MLKRDKTMKTDIEIIKKVFRQKDFKEFEDFTVDFIRNQNQIQIVLTFQHVLSAIELFNRLKKHAE
jgi:hypothetical protein